MVKVATLFILFTTCALAAFMPSFKSGRYYRADGRWIVHEGKSLFKVNEGSANEEVIFFNVDKNEFQHLVKYSLCFKILADCHLTCKGELVKKIKMLEPWDETSILSSRADNTHPDSKLEACKADE